MTAIYPVVLCGGSGTRLWPRSRKTKPKPFLPLIGERTMFEATLGRCGEPEQFAAPVIVTGTAHLDHVEEQARGFPGATVIVEPEAKNTAAAIALAAGRLPPDAVMLVCPSDHHIADEPAYSALVNRPDFQALRREIFARQADERRRAGPIQDIYAALGQRMAA